MIFNCVGIVELCIPHGEKMIVFVPYGGFLKALRSE